ncbi:MAG TPA: GAF domain-containing protein [Kiritimatiellia bacterium]|nr:GAF domain-containing protein [Kiritimatiellia bacterium]HPS07525.1 GAF domain-containing protein [Kiritimatiellia bacterium]
MTGEEIEIVVPENILGNWQEILNSLARIANIPAALIMRLRDADIEVLVSSQSKENPYHPGDKERFQESGLYCETVIRTQDKLLVPDALADDKWKNNPDKKLNMISYLGFPLLLPSKQPFGTICVLDSKRNEYSEALETLMLNLKKLIESHLELIYMNAVLGDKSKRLTDYLMELQTLRGIVPICAHCKSIRDKENRWHPIEHYLVKHPQADFSHGICPACLKKLYPEVEEETP